MSYLIMRRGPEPGKIYPLDTDEVKIGRGSKNDIIIHDNEVSRNHMRLVLTTGGYELHDLNSSNGTFVNGQEVDGVWLLQSQAIIELGDSITFEYRMGNPEDDPDLSEMYKSRAPVPVKEKSYLVINIDTQPEPAVYPLEGMTINVGRSTSNDIVIVEPELSREHFRLTLMPQGYFVEDLGSTNGTFVNGEPLGGQRLLYANDIIQIGTTIRLRLTNSPESFMDRTTTSLLDGQGKPVPSKRKTSRLEVPDISQPGPSPTDIGTGVDHVSLEDEVLITYARDDWEQVVAPLVDTLYEEDIKSWVDQYLIERSNDWLLATEQARLECWLLVVIISPAAMKSELVRKNWRHFQNREKPILLVIHKPVERMPIGASKFTTVQYNPAVPDLAFRQVVREIKRLRATLPGKSDVDSETADDQSSQGSSVDTSRQSESPAPDAVSTEDKSLQASSDTPRQGENGESPASDAVSTETDKTLSKRIEKAGGVLVLPIQSHGTERRTSQNAVKQNTVEVPATKPTKGDDESGILASKKPVESATKDADAVTDTVEADAPSVDETSVDETTIDESGADSDSTPSDKSE